MRKILRFTVELLSFPEFSQGSWKVLLRQWKIFSYHPFLETLYILIEPLFLWITLGLGLGAWIGEVERHTYAQYLLPALAGLMVVFIPFLEIIQNVSAQFKNSNSYWILLQTPLSKKDLAAGEILWATLKGVAGGIIILCLGAVFGVNKTHFLFASPLFLFPAALLFSSLSLLFMVRQNPLVRPFLIIFIILVPLSFWSDTFFPTSSLHPTINFFLHFSPITYLTQSLRNLSWERINSVLYLNLAILWLTSAIIYNLSVRCFVKKISV